MNQVEKIIRGLYALDKGRPFPADFGVQSFYACDEWVRPIPAMLDPFRAFLPWPQAWHITDPDTFFYGRAYAEDCGHSVWFTVFYNSVTFLSFVGRDDWLDEHRKKFSDQPNKRDIRDKYDFKEIR